jgi:hypothetical protein
MKWAIVSVLAIVGCHKGTGVGGGSGPSCKQIVDHMVDVATKEHDDRTVREISGHDAIKACEGLEMTVDERTCIVKAQSMNAIETCAHHTHKLEEQRRAAEAKAEDVRDQEQLEMEKAKAEYERRLDGGSSADAHQ